MAYDVTRHTGWSTRDSPRFEWIVNLAKIHNQLREQIQLALANNKRYLAILSAK
jgi:hypothetical protein